jgi:enediyne biosynthesis protein E4
LGLAEHTGWWTSLAVGDFDGDGRPDLAVGNWGRNSIYELYQPTRLRAWFGEWGVPGRTDLVEAWQQGNRWLPVQDRTALGTAIPDVPQRFVTHAAYAAADVPAILGDRFAKARFVEAAEFESVVFLNRSTRFERVPLPREAQFSPVMSIRVGDLDGDGHEDLFLAQNFFGYVSDYSRDDAGRGLWLRGNGDGTFKAVDASVAGINVPGEQRGSALADFDHDGRVDLVVCQNNGATKLYANRRAARGLRVRLKGPAANPDGVGAQLRVVYADKRLGPCRSVQASGAQVLGSAEKPTAVWVRWPDGIEQTVAVKDETWDIVVEAEHVSK